jgi:hypothetical protein
MLRLDLEAAGIPYRDDADRVADFHALRHSYITLLEPSGVSPKMAQELARHSDIRQTMNVYTHAGLHDLAGAVENLPALLPGEKAEVLAATGTDGPADPPPLTGLLTGGADAECVPVRTHETTPMGGEGTATGPNHLILLGVGDVIACKAGEPPLLVQATSLP